MVHHGVIVDQIRSVPDILPCVLVDEILSKVVMVYTLKGVHAYLIEYGNMTTVVARGASAAVIVVDSMLGYRGSLIRKAKSHLLHSTPNIQRPATPPPSTPHQKYWHSRWHFVQYILEDKVRRNNEPLGPGSAKRLLREQAPSTETLPQCPQCSPNVPTTGRMPLAQG